MIFLPNLIEPLKIMLIFLPAKMSVDLQLVTFVPVFVMGRIFFLPDNLLEKILRGEKTFK